MLPIFTYGHWNYRNLNFYGVSVAGVSTCLICPELALSFDVAQGLPQATTMQTFLITHAHMDHAAGIPYIISQKALTGQKPGRFFMPENVVEPMTDILKKWSGLEGHEYEFEFIPVKNNDCFPLTKSLSLECFPTVHRVPSNGYTIIEHKKKLKPEFQGLDAHQIRKARASGQQVEERIAHPLVSFTGDTQIEFLDRSERVKKSEILFMEVTYIDAKRSVERAKKWGHIHLEELFYRLDDLECEKLVLIHLSARHRPEELHRVLEMRLPENWQGRVEVFPQQVMKLQK